MTAFAILAAFALAVIPDDPQEFVEMNATMIRKGFAVFALVFKLRGMPQQTPDGIVDFVISQPVIKPLQVESELRAFAHLVAQLRPRTILEIGTCIGGTLCVLSRLAAPDATIISVDLPGGPYGGGYGPVRQAIFRLFPSNGQSLHLVKDDSHLLRTKERVVKLLSGQPLDLLFIDGDHTYEGVKQDFEMYAPLVRPGGMVAFHDILEHPAYPEVGVHRFWQEARDGTSKELVENANQGWAGIGVSYR